MKAIIYTHYGPPEVLQLKEVDKPAPKDDELLVKVRATEATKSDCEMRKCHFAVKWLWLPVRITLGITKPKRPILGMYFAGEVESAGKDVTKFKKGDRVFGSSKFRLGAYAEYVCLPANYSIVLKPDAMTFEEAAAVPLGGLNALHFLRKANIQRGEKVLVNGAGGSIGVFGVQIAKAMGAEVTAVDSAIKEDMLRRIGADHFIDYAKEDFTKSGKTYDVIFSMVARTSYFACIKALNPKGRYVIANPRISDMPRSLATSAFTDKAAIFTFAEETEAELLALKEMLEDGRIKAVVDKVYPLELTAEAHRRVETEQRLGPVVISVRGHQ
jgi:NADPH:quinone reductase-like Zn-dependent oxidoreductase